MAASHEVEPYRPYGCKTDWKRFLKAGEELTRGQLLLSADHKSKALVQDDGNFVVYSHDPDGNEIVTFATGTDADPGATSSSSDLKKLGFRLVMQRDHDLVLLSDSGEVIWRTNTVGKGMGGETVYAALDDGGVLHVIDAAGGSVWNSGGSVLSQLRTSARDAATVALQAGSFAKEKALAAAGSALEAGKGLAGAAIGAGRAALARATGGSGGGGESA